MEKNGGEIRNLNSEQKEAATFEDKPLLIVAGAGTGKTRTLTSRIIHLIERGVTPGKICALTFTNKAAREMLERVSGVKYQVSSEKRGSEQPFIGTFHSLGARILRENPEPLGRKRNFVIFDADDSFRLIKKLVKALGDENKTIKPAEFRDKISWIKNGMVSLEVIKKSAKPSDKFLAKLFRVYEEKLAQNNAFDFDDLIEKVVWLFGARPRVLEKYWRKFSHFLVDEYQDINNVQCDFIRFLAKNGSNLSVVGDHNQTIYTWRGSNLGIFLNFGGDWAGAKTVFMGRNYRSTANIIEAASALVRDARRPAGLGDGRLWTENPAGDLVGVRESLDEVDEAGWIAEQVLSVPEKKSKISHGAGKYQVSGPEENVGVLYRTNAQSRAIEQALIEAEIPYQIFGGIRFYERREIKDILAALRLASNPADEISRERLEKALRKPVFRELMGALATTKNFLPTELIDVFIKTTKYLEYIDSNLTNPEERKENIVELKVFAGGFRSLEDFLEKVSLLQATDEIRDRGLETRDRERRVSLMTIHLAKGLEFDNVFIAGVNEGLLPHHRSMSGQSELEEERRLMYVAMTRARRRLFLSFYDLPSRFLSEIPEKFLEIQTKRALEDEERYIAID